MSGYIKPIKEAARIMHDSLDSELERLANYACAELIRAGVPPEDVNDTEPLILNAVVTRVIMEIGDDKSYEKARESWEYQLDNLRKHDWGNGNVQ